MPVTPGTVIASIPAGIATSVSSGLANVASTSTDNIVNWAVLPPAFGLSLVGHITGLTPFGGSDSEMIKEGDLMYIRGDRELAVVDVSDPTSPTLVGSGDIGTFGNQRWGVAKVGDYVYSVDSSLNGINVWDVSDLSTPTFVTTLGDVTYLNNPIGQLHHEGNYLYGVDWDNGIYIIDISTPGAPTLAGGVLGPNPWPKDEWDAPKVGNYIFTTSYNFNTLLVFDVSNPAAPTFAGSLVDTLLETPFVGPVVDGDYCYVAAELANAFTVIDISDPTTPTLHGSVVHAAAFNSPWLRMIKNGDRFYVCNYSRFVGGYDQGSLAVVDVSDPANPSVEGFLEGPYLKGLYSTPVLYGDRLIVASYWGNEGTGYQPVTHGAVHAINVSDPTAPYLETSAELPGSTDHPGPSMILEGDYLYVITYDASNQDGGLAIYSLIVQDALFTGGTVTAEGSEIVHTFYDDGVLTPIFAVGSINVDRFAIAGGGAGGAAGAERTGGGGGNGEYVADTITLGPANAVTVTIGPGGTLTSGTGNTGGLTINAIAGGATKTLVGGAGGGANGGGTANGANGGAAGGGGAQHGGTGGTGAHTGGNGYNSGGADNFGAGGGAGASANGENAQSSTSGHAGNGGAGVEWPASSGDFWGGGGGGGAQRFTGSYTFGVGGSSIGGQGARDSFGQSSSIPPASNTGSGGGGGAGNGLAATPGAAGITIFRYDPSTIV